MNEWSLWSDPELYDLLNPNIQSEAELTEVQKRLRDSERLYLEEAQRSRGRVLELACGSGRLTIPIAGKGIEVVGLDLSLPMLDAARAKASAAGVRVQFFQGDMRCFDVPGEFSTILVAHNSLLFLLGFEDLKQCLCCVHRHLVPGGRLVFDIVNPTISLLSRNPQQRYPLLTAKHPERGEISVEVTASYDAATQIRNIRRYYSLPDAPDFHVTDRHIRMIFPQELSLLLDATGFHLENRYGGYSREPFESSSLRQVCTCTRVTDSSYLSKN